MYSFSQVNSADICPKSDIIQLDGNVTGLSDSTNSSTDTNNTIYDTEDEAFEKVIPANFYPEPGQSSVPNQPLVFDIKANEPSSSLPLCLVLNARSIWNKCDSLRELLHQIGPDLCLISESWEQERRQINS